MKEILLNARAKINITLDVIGKNSDGYHDLSMIMQTINLCDNVSIKKTSSKGVKMSCNLKWMPCDDRNIVYRAAQLMKEKYKIKDGININLVKNIPVSAGLAGGSTDCASTLVGIRNLFSLDITDKQLIQIGKSLGADVPYCILRGTALAEGIGDKLTKLPPFPNCSVLIVKPPINVSTASVFGAFDNSAVNKNERPDNNLVIELIKNNDLKGICNNMRNVLESVTIKNYPIIDDIKQMMLDKGAIGSMMSGSGPTVFGFYNSYNEAVKVLRTIRDKHKFREMYITTIFNTDNKDNFSQK